MQQRNITQNIDGTYEPMTGEGVQHEVFGPNEQIDMNKNTHLLLY